ncbi:MAG: hypothetical protein SPF70_08745 [Lachnospiraceae bacterium]|nr:hypothetical protein [Lachnospiraceae bacterium]
MKNCILPRYPTQEGKAIARQNPDFKEGRPKKFSKAQIDHAVELLSDYSYKQVEQMTGISKSTLIRAKKRSEFDFYRIINVNFDDYVDKFDKVTYNNITNICKTTTKVY